MTLWTPPAAILRAHLATLFPDVVIAVATSSGFIAVSIGLSVWQRLTLTKHRVDRAIQKWVAVDPAVRRVVVAWRTI